MTHRIERGDGWELFLGPDKARTLQNRFYSKITKEPGGCWVWTGHKDKDGYGTFAVTSYWRERAHRMIVKASRPLAFADVVMHTCDNPPCVNPDHLHVGTQKENIQDMDRKGRRAIGYSRPNASGDEHWSRQRPSLVKRGEDSHRAKLSESDVVEILERIDNGETHSSIAMDFPVSKSMISRIRTGKAWKHVKGGARTLFTEAPKVAPAETGDLFGGDS